MTVPIQAVPYYLDEGHRFWLALHKQQYKVHHCPFCGRYHKCMATRGNAEAHAESYMGCMECRLKLKRGEYAKLYTRHNIQ